MTARSVLEHALTAYYGADAPEGYDPTATVGKLLGAFAAEVLEPEKARAGRLEVELTQVRGALRNTCDHVAELEDQVGELSAKVYAASTVKCWTNEDGKRFMFAEDLAAALGYDTAGGA